MTKASDAPHVDRAGVLRYRFARHQLDRAAGSASKRTDASLLDFGVQDTGPDGAAWALACRGASADGSENLAYAWTIRGAPHAYRRADLRAVAVATAPLSEADAAKRIFDASAPLKAAGISVLDALTVVADHLREIVKKPMVKGEVSSRLTEVVDEPYLRYCRPCKATHVYEMPFRLAALQAGLELEPCTSPPVLRRIPRLRAPGYAHLATDADPLVDVIRNYLRFYGPARQRDTAMYLDAPAKDVKEAWPDDAVEVTVAGEGKGRAGPRFILPDDLEVLTAAADAEKDGDPTVRLLGPYDPYLQLRDRELLVPGEAHRKDLWRVLGRPGAIVADGEVVGTWRPRTAAQRLTVRIDPWKRLPARHRAAVDEQAERLAVHRGVTLAAVNAD